MTERSILASGVAALLLGVVAPVACSSDSKSVPIAEAGGAGGAGGQSAEAGAAGVPAVVPPVVPGGTGAFGVVTVNGIQKMYLPLADRSSTGSGLIAVVDVGLKGDGVNGARALLTDIDLGVPGDTTATAAFATTTSGTADVVIAASTAFPDIWFIDPQRDVVTKHITLDAEAGQSSFSGGGGYVTGIAMDPTHQRAILSVWNGFAIIDLKTQKITKTIEAPPAENFGFDAKNGLILDPFYECSGSRNSTGPLTLCSDFKTSSGVVVSDGLAIIDLNDESIYNYDDPSAASPRSPGLPVGSEPDSAAADPDLGLVIVPSEGGGFQNIIDFGHAKFDSRAGLFTARNYVLPNFGLTGVAIEPVQHFALLETENSSAVAVLDLTKLADRAQADATAESGQGGAGGEGGAPSVPEVPLDANLIDAALVRGVRTNMPALPDNSSWANIGDPHGVAVTTGINDNRSVGFLVNSQRHWVARIDLDTALWLGNATKATSPDISAAVTFLDARTRKPGAEGGAGGAGDAGGAGGAVNAGGAPSE